MTSLYGTFLFVLSILWVSIGINLATEVGEGKHIYDNYKDGIVAIILASAVIGPAIIILSLVFLTLEV